MDLSNDRLAGKSSGVGRTPVAISLTMALLGGLAAVIAMVALVMRGPVQLEALAMPPAGIVTGIGLAILLAILVVLTAIFIVLLMLLCGGGCGCGCNEMKSPLGLLAALFPAVPAGLRAAAHGFDAAADAAHASIGPLRTTGSSLHDTVGPAIGQLEVPGVDLPNKLLWDVLHDLHLVHGPAPAFMDSIYVLTGGQLTATTPLADLGTQVTDGGGNLRQAADQASAVEGDLRAGARGLRGIATAIDGQP